MTAVERRRARRYPSNWSARYRFDTTAEWRDCRIIDVSLDGAAVELYNHNAVESITGMLHLEIDSGAGDQIGVALGAQIRHSVRLQDVRLLVGVEFAALGRDERNLLHLLIGLRSLV